MQRGFDYDEPVRQKRKKHTLVLLALFLTVFAPQEVERMRGALAKGSTQAVNCVHALFPSLELEFATPTRPGSHTAVYSVACGGSLEEVAYETSLTTAQSFSTPVSHLPALPSSPVSATLPSTQVIGRGVEIRGPPLPCVALVAPSLRAPPIA
jgi:hypothetical protein